MRSSPDPEQQILLHHAMQAPGLAAVLAWHPAEVLLVSGTFSHLEMTLCLGPQQGEPILYFPSHEPVDTAPDVFQRRYYTLRSTPELSLWDDLQSQLMQNLQQRNLIGQPIGYSSSGSKQTLSGNAAETSLLSDKVIPTLLTGPQIHHAPAFFSQSCQYKTVQQHVALRRANTLAAIGLHTFFDLAQPGHTIAEIAGQVETTIQACSGLHGCASARAWAFVQAGPNTQFAGTYSRSSGYTLAKNDIVVIELGTCVDGYWSDLTRTTCVGTPSVQQRTLIKAVQDAQEAALAAIQPGVSHKAIDQAAREVLETRGYGTGFTHPTGHHVGFRYHDEGPMLEASSDAPITQGMILTIEPGVYGAVYGGGARVEDNVYVGPDGPELLSPFSLGRVG